MCSYDLPSFSQSSFAPFIAFSMHVNLKPGPQNTPDNMVRIPVIASLLSSSTGRPSVFEIHPDTKNETAKIQLTVFIGVSPRLIRLVVSYQSSDRPRSPGADQSLKPECLLELYF
jgi:hypothetical protein